MIAMTNTAVVVVQMPARFHNFQVVKNIHTNQYIEQISEPKIRRRTCTCAVVVIEFFFILSHQITLSISDINCSLNAVYFLYSLLTSSLPCLLSLTLLLFLQASLRSLFLFTLSTGLFSQGSSFSHASLGSQFCFHSKLLFSLSLISFQNFVCFCLFLFTL